MSAQSKIIHPCQSTNNSNVPSPSSHPQYQSATNIKPSSLSIHRPSQATSIPSHTTTAPPIIHPKPHPHQTIINTKSQCMPSRNQYHVIAQPKPPCMSNHRPDQCITSVKPAPLSIHTHRVAYMPSHIHTKPHPYKSNATVSHRHSKQQPRPRHHTPNNHLRKVPTSIHNPHSTSSTASHAHAKSPPDQATGISNDHPYQGTNISIHTPRQTIIPLNSHRRQATSLPSHLHLESHPSQVTSLSSHIRRRSPPSNATSIPSNIPTTSPPSQTITPRKQTLPNHHHPQTNQSPLSNHTQTKPTSIPNPQYISTNRPHNVTQVPSRIRIKSHTYQAESIASHHKYKTGITVKPHSIQHTHTYKHIINSN